MCFVSESHCFPFDTGGRIKNKVDFRANSIVENYGSSEFLTFRIELLGKHFKMGRNEFQ